MIIGLTGTKAAGKGAVSEILKEKGFIYSSLSDRVREEADKRGLIEGKRTVTDLQNIGNDLRKKEGLGTLARRTLDTPNVRVAENIVIDGIRNPGEIEVFREYDEQGFWLIAVDAPQEVRFKRLLKRGRNSDPKEWEGFLVVDKRDVGSGEVTSGQQVGKCIESADYLFWKDFPNLKDSNKYFISDKKGFINLFPQLSGGKARIPSFDEEFMRQAFEWSFRSKCLSRHVGAVIAIEDILISEGYNGPPRGVKHCKDRGGCYRRTHNIPSGTQLELCYAKHGEENAILNAGRTGRSVVGATLHSTTYPCSNCTGTIINSGVSKVIYLTGYHSPLAKDMFDDAGTKVERFSGVTPQGFSRIWG